MQSELLDTAGEALAHWRKQLVKLKGQWRDTPSCDSVQRTQLKSALRVVYQRLRDCGAGPHSTPVNYVYVKRDTFSIWHIQHQRVEMPPTLSVRQAVELLTNGQCGD